MVYQDLIYKLLNNEFEHLHIEEGFGRKVILLNNLVIKIPKNISNDVRSCIMQSELEYTIYSKEHSDVLCPIFYYDNGITIMKRVESNPDVLLSLIPSNLTFKEMIFNLYGKEILHLADTYNLNLSDLVNITNWGYDKELKRFVCLDYGLRNNIEKMNLF